MKKKLSLFLVLLFAFGTLAEANLDYDKEGKKFPPIFYSYKSEKNGKFEVYVKTGEKSYILFNIFHEYAPKIYQNLWRIKDSFMCDFDYDKGEMTKKYPVLTGGENEFVWFSARPGVGEATGGFHGNERIDVDDKCFVKFYADNKELKFNEDIPLTSASSFYYIQYSTMHETGTGGLIHSSTYKPVEGYPIECYHEKKTIFKNMGYVTKNKVWWETEVPVDHVYYGIFCVTKDISKYGYNDDKGKKPNIIEFNEDGQFKLKSANPRIVMYNDEKGIRVVCDSKVIKGGPFEQNTTIRDHDFYHKYYRGIHSERPILASKGDIWETEASISFILEK